MYPVVQWVNGQPSAKQVGGVSYTGGWFMSAENAPKHGDEAPEKWAEYELVHRDGSSTDGFATEGLQVAVIAMRQRWEVYGSGQRQVFPWSQYEKAKGYGNPRGRLHMLCGIRGMEHQGQFLITMSGMTAASVTKRGGVLQRFDSTVVYEANLQLHRHAMESGDTPQRAPRWLFWMPICSQRKAGDFKVPVFSTVGKGQNTSQVTYPTLFGIPEDHESVDLGKLFVGNDNKELFTEWAVSAAAWVEEWNNLTPGASAADADGYADEPPKKLPGTGRDDIDFMSPPGASDYTQEPLEEIPF